MKLVYYSGTKLPFCQVAAAIHLNRLPLDEVPKMKQLVQSIASLETSKEGIPVRLGRDESGNEIYSLHLGKAWSLGLQTVGFILSAHSNPLDWKFFNVGFALSFSTRARTFVLKHLKLVKLHRELVACEIQKRYWEIATRVRNTKELRISDG